MTTTSDSPLVEATGSDDPAVQAWVLRQADEIEAMAGRPAAANAEARQQRLVALMRGMLRGGLADPLLSSQSQMLALHKAAMACFRRSAEAEADAAGLEGLAKAPRL